MARYTTDKEFSFGDLTQKRHLVVNGEVNIYVWDGVAFILSDNFDTGAYNLNTSRLQIKIEVVSGSFSIDEVF